MLALNVKNGADRAAFSSAATRAMRVNLRRIGLKNHSVAVNRGKETTESLVTPDGTDQKLLKYFSDFSGNPVLKNLAHSQ
ncbi:MAG: hypothetical protein DVB26_09515 [Verrucomicrobia bacterium]|nr:MAG: hypothetical protein DVB26_09515 [Verrucomicrobiota bacterium]